LTSQAALDLLWVVNSPSFVAGENVAPPMHLTAEMIDAEALNTFVATKKSHRVGHYFEALLHFWLACIRKVDMVGAGIQLRDGKRTIGEIDFLYRDEAGMLTHCEASVKFFLHHPRPDTSHFPGPNATDNFERKITKLFEQQLSASETTYPDVVQRHAFVKGIVFYHHDDALPAELPARMPTDHQRGRWLRACELDQLRGQEDVVGCIADKPHWLAPAEATPLMDMPDLCDQMDEHFEGRAHPLMVSLRNPASGTETERLFVVSNTWPATEG